MPGSRSTTWLLPSLTRRPCCCWASTVVARRRRRCWRSASADTAPHARPRSERPVQSAFGGLGHGRSRTSSHAVTAAFAAAGRCATARAARAWLGRQRVTRQCASEVQPVVSARGIGPFAVWSSMMRRSFCARHATRTWDRTDCRHWLAGVRPDSRRTLGTRRRVGIPVGRRRQRICHRPAALRAVARATDGRGPDTRLTAAPARKTRVGSPWELIPAFHEDSGARQRIASLAPMCWQRPRTVMRSRRTSRSRRRRS